MPHLKGMYAPGNDCAHILAPAGFSLFLPPDVFRFNRVAPMYPPDPCIRPNEGDLVCPPERPPCPVNYPSMPAAGTDTRMLSDAFRFNKVYHFDICNPCKLSEQSCSSISMAPKMSKQLCPCTKKPRYPPSKHARHYDFRYPGGGTECNSSVHRHGHVPEGCTMTFPSDSEIVCHDLPQSSDCKISLPNAPSCGVQDMIAYDHSGRGGSQIFDDASMYNNAPSTCSYGGPKDFRSRGAPDPYAITGNLHYKSSGYATDKSCALIPAERGDKKVDFVAPCPYCPLPYYPSNYICRPVYNRKYLLDCPEQDGPPADTYTFL